jgi:hypothetical protein
MLELGAFFVTCSTVGYGTYAYNMLLYLEHSITRGLYILPSHPLICETKIVSPLLHNAIITPSWTLFFILPVLDLFYPFNFNFYIIFSLLFRFLLTFSPSCSNLNTTYQYVFIYEKLFFKSRK